MTTPIPPAVIDGPEFPLAGYGLFSAASGPVPLTGHSRAGILYETLCVAAAGGVWAGTCDTSPPQTNKTAPAAPNPASVTGSAFTVWAVEDCLMGRTATEIRARAVRRLELGEQYTVENTFWIGSAGNTPALATSTPTIISGGPMPLVAGVSALEEWLGTNAPTSGVLHAPRRVAAYASHYYVSHRFGARLETPLGLSWAFGRGYTTAGPTGQAAATTGQAWIYATRPVTIRRTEISVPAGVLEGAAIVAQNSALVVAERTYIVDYACGTAAALVDLTECPCAAAA